MRKDLWFRPVVVTMAVTLGVRADVAPDNLANVGLR